MILGLGDRNLGSFRDPSGHIYESNGRVFRTISETAIIDYESLKTDGFYEKLAGTGYALGADEIDLSNFANLPAGVSLIVEHPKIPYISYPYEWGFQQLKAAALLHLDLQLFSLDHGAVLKDSSAYNVQFIGPKPVFIDFLSFRPYNEGEYWDGHSQFCQQFLNPLLLRAKLGVPHNSWFRGNLEGLSTADFNRLLPGRKKASWNMLSHVVLPAYLQRRASAMQTDSLRQAKAKPFPKPSYRNLLLQLREWIAKLKPADKYASTWADYSDHNTYGTEDADSKSSFIGRFAQQVKPALMWDLGCNTGRYSHLAIRKGAEMAIGFDFDMQALDKAFIHATSQDIALLPLFLDAANPSPGLGWAHSERQSLATRSNADAVIALAFIHHLAIGKNIPLEWVVDWIVSLAPQGIIEFVQKDDPTVLKMLALRKDIFTDYNEANFRRHLEQRAKIVESEKITSSGRTLYRFSRHEYDK